MTPEQIHDALTLLPSDLIAEVDEKRNRKPKVIPLKRYAAMAASFVLVLCSGLYCLQLFGSMGASKETAALPTLAQQENSLYAEAAPEAPAAQAAPREDICSVPTAPASEENAGAGSSSCHTHITEEPAEEDPQMDTPPYSTHQVITPSLDGYHSDHDVTLITSRQELESYWASFAHRYDFSNMSFICDTYGYDDSWFEENDLLLNVVYSRAGVTYDVTSITDAGGDHGWEWEVLISIQGSFYPENEEATYHLLTRLQKGVIAPEDDIIQVHDVCEAEPKE